MKRRLKRIVTPVVTPVFRLLVRYLPVPTIRELVWRRVVCRYLLWRPREFQARTFFGATIAGDTTDFIQRQLYYFGAWEPHLTNWLSGQLGPGDVFVDVGANIGYFSLLASRLVGDDGHVVAVEASPALAERLRENLVRNRAANVTLVNAVAAASRGTQVVYRGDDANVGQTTAVRVAGFDEEARVAAAPLSDLIDAALVPRVRVIKIDVQGFEADVVQGLVRLLPSLPLQCSLVVEVHPELLALLGTGPEAVVDPLAAAGFVPYRLDVDYAPVTHLRRARRARPRRLDGPIEAECDLIFTRTGADGSHAASPPVGGAGAAPHR